MSLIKPIKKEEKEIYNFILQSLDTMNMSVDDLEMLKYLSPYLILDGHRTGTKHDMVTGYMEGATFSLRFASILKKMGGKRATFLIHTLRNYKTMDRIKAIFDGVEQIGADFIKTAYKKNIKLTYYGHDVHDKYSLSKLINAAENATGICNGFHLNYLTNYSDTWGSEHKQQMDELPEITVIGRFTKGHYSGAGIPGKASKANFIYIQQASISENWSDDQMIILILGLLKSHIALHGFVGGKSYQKGEKEEIYRKREEELWEENYEFPSGIKPKRMTTFTPIGPVTIKF